MPRFKYERAANSAREITVAKKICISRDAHDRLKSLRREGETFSEAILRAIDAE